MEPANLVGRVYCLRSDRSSRGSSAAGLGVEAHHRTRGVAGLPEGEGLGDILTSCGRRRLRALPRSSAWGGPSVARQGGPGYGEQHARGQDVTAQREGGRLERRDHIAPLQACLPDPAIIGSWRSWSRSLRSS